MWEKKKHNAALRSIRICGWNMHFPALYSSCIYPEGAIDIFRDVQFKQIIPDLLSACWYQRCYHQLEKQQM